MMSFFNFFKAWLVTKYAKARGFKVLASPKTEAVRFFHCKMCPFFKDGSCTVCGCLIEAKIMLNTEKCPKNFWSRVWERAVTVNR